MLFDGDKIVLLEFFSKWLSLNFMNSMNHDKVPKWSGYQRLYPSVKIYITIGSNTKCISITTSGLMSIATHHIEQILQQR